MTIQEIHELRQSIVDLQGFCNGGELRKKKEGRIDKCGTGFNIDDRFMMCETHQIHFDSYYGYYGNSGCYTQIELPKSVHKLFWKCFDQYLNENQDEILNAVCQKMKKRLGEETDVIKKECDRLNRLLEDLRTLQDETREKENI